MISKSRTRNNPTESEKDLTPLHAITDGGSMAGKTLKEEMRCHDYNILLVFDYPSSKILVPIQVTYYKNDEKVSESIQIMNLEEADELAQLIVGLGRCYGDEEEEICYSFLTEAELDQLLQFLKEHWEDDAVGVFLTKRCILYLDEVRKTGESNERVLSGSSGEPRGG